MSSFSYSTNEEISMNIKMKQICEPGATLTYIYDFGSSTELQVKIIDKVAVSFAENEDIILLSRNAKLLIPCDQCSKFPAKHICTQCIWDDAGWLCDKCAATHRCDEEWFLPVVNSPRAGVCAYIGGHEER